MRYLKEKLTIWNVTPWRIAKVSDVLINEEQMKSSF
jgi:hypothetical protein